MPRPRERVCLQDGLKLDLNRLARKGFIKHGATIGVRGITWTHSYWGDDLGPPLANLASKQVRMSASPKDRIGIVVDHDAVLTPEQDDRYGRMQRYADGGFQARGHDSSGQASDQSWLAISFAVVPPPARSALWLPPITSKYTSPHAQTAFQFQQSKLREDTEVPHAVGIKEGDALDRPDGFEGQGMLCVFNGRWPRVLASALDRERATPASGGRSCALFTRRYPLSAVFAEPPFTTDW